MALFWGGFGLAVKAQEQGLTRLDRGLHFVAISREAADRSGTPCNWTARIVPGTGHDSRKMAVAAAAELFFV